MPTRTAAALRIAATLLLVCAGGIPARAQVKEPEARAEGKALAVGVIDFVKVFDTYPRYLEGKKRLLEVDAENRKRLDELQGRMNDLKVQRDMREQGTIERAQYEHELNMALQNLKGMQQLLKGDVDLRYEKLMAECYEEIERVIAQVVKERGVQLVLRVHRDVGDGTVPDKLRVFERRIVWFAADEIDLTPAVIKLLQVPSAPPGDGDKDK